MKYIFIIIYSLLASAQNIDLQGSVNFELVGAAKASIHGDLEIDASSSFIQNGSPTFTLEGDWINSGGYTSGNGVVFFSGSITQSITNPDNNNFYELWVSKSSGTVTIPSGSSFTVDGSLNFNSTADGNIFTRDNALIRVSTASITQNGTGFVDGPLAVFLGTGDQNNTTFTIGNNEDYTPVEIDLEGVGGTPGYLQITSNTLTLDLLPSQIDPDLAVEREYDLELPAGSAFDIGASRSFTMVIHYINPDDLRNGANSNTFETARYDGPLWAPALMQTGARTNSSVQSLQNTNLGTYVVGPENYFMILYSRSSGSFEDPTNWSVYEYGGFVNSFAPRNRDIVFIGDGDQIQLTNDHQILEQRTLTVETAGPSGESGTFLMGENVVSGSGTFTLNAGGNLGIGTAAGLVNGPTLAGNIQTSKRNYNPGNHNDGVFIYSSTSSSTVGDGLPATVRDLYIQTQDDLDLLQSTNITNDLIISSGTFDLQSFDIAGTNSGTFTISNNAALNLASTNDLSTSLDGFGEYNLAVNSTIDFYGTDQTLTNFPANFNTTLGYGNIIARNTGTKLIDADLLVRGNVTILSGATLQNEANVSSFWVYGNFDNINSNFVNFGKIILGN